MHPVDVSIRRPVTVFIAAVAALVFGAVAFRELATDLLPDITYPSVTIRTGLEGAAPLEVENLVTRPVENAVGVVGNLVRISSSSRADVSEVTLEFGWGTSMDFAALDVRERLDVLRLPPDAAPPVLLRYDPSLDPILRLAVAGDTDLARLRRVAEERIQRPLERLEGVAAVVVQGGLEEEIQVEVDERQLAALGLTMDRLVSRLAAENVNVTGGRLRDGSTELMVRTVNELLRPAQLEDLVVAQLGDGRAMVRLRDVASVRRGFREREILTRLDGVESVEVAIFKAGGTNTVTVSKAVRERLDEVTEGLAAVDPNLRLVGITDQARYIESSVREVLETAALGGVLAIFVLFLFLRSWRTTLVIGAAIPISVVATFFLMYVFDISLNIMSLGGLTLGIGLLVDNAIVVLESIQRRRDGGADPVEAARVGAKEVSAAISASTLTSICVFLPIVFVEGVAAQFFSDQALTVTFSLLVSLVVALTVIPMLSSRRLGAGGEADGGLEGEEPPGPILRGTSAAVSALLWTFGRLLRPVVWLLERPAAAFQAGVSRLDRGYGRLLDLGLRRPLWVLLAAAALFASSLALVPHLGRELVPELEQGEFFVDLELPPGTHLDLTQRRMASLEGAAMELPGVKSVYAVVGGSGQEGGQASENREYRGRLTVSMAEPFSRERERRAMAQVRRLVAEDGDFEGLFGRPSYFSFKTPIEIELRGFNLVLLKRLSASLVERLRGTPGFTDVESSAEGGTPELQIRFDRQRLAAYGLTVQDAAEVVRSKVQGDVATEVQRQDRTIDIRLRSREADRDSAEDLRDLIVHQVGGTALPLSAVAEVTAGEGPAEIRRVDGERAALVTANLEGLDLASASQAIEGAMADLELPAGFDWRLGGQKQEMETSFDSMRLALALAIFLVYLVMASQFESLLHPFVILFSVPLSSIGVLATLWVFDVRLSVVVLIGVVLLAGIVVNNAIILVDTANRLRRTEGHTKVEAIRRAGRLRLRPILMTTATTVLGLLPMAVGLGEGSELRTPMATAVIGGLLVSTLLTLVVIPALYRLLGR
ncbi:MAG: efflux RND transporter permease subunit [Acidobacteriota bacterium]